MTDACPRVRACWYLQRWEKHREVWDKDKHAYIKRYAKNVRQISQLDDDINKCARAHT